MHSRRHGVDGNEDLDLEDLDLLDLAEAFQRIAESVKL